MVAVLGAGLRWAGLALGLLLLLLLGLRLLLLLWPPCPCPWECECECWLVCVFLLACECLLECAWWRVCVCLPECECECGGGCECVLAGLFRRSRSPLWTCAERVRGRWRCREGGRRGGGRVWHSKGKEAGPMDDNAAS